MRREICLWVEWSWSNGRLPSDARREEIETWALALAEDFRRRSPRHFGSLSESAAHIAVEIQRTLRTLSYGARAPESIHPARRDYLKMHFNTPERALPKFVTPVS